MVPREGRALVRIWRLEDAPRRWRARFPRVSRSWIALVRNAGEARVLEFDFSGLTLVFTPEESINLPGGAVLCSGSLDFSAKETEPVEPESGNSPALVVAGTVS